MLPLIILKAANKGRKQQQHQVPSCQIAKSKKTKTKILKEKSSSRNEI